MITASKCPLSALVHLSLVQTVGFFCFVWEGKVVGWFFLYVVFGVGSFLCKLVFLGQLLFLL